MSNVMDLGAAIVVDVVQIRPKCPAKTAQISPKPIAGNASRKVRSYAASAVTPIVGTVVAVDMASTVLAVMPACATGVKMGMSVKKVRKTRHSFFSCSATSTSVRKVSPPAFAQREHEDENNEHSNPEWSVVFL